MWEFAVNHPVAERNNERKQFEKRTPKYELRTTGGKEILVSWL